MKTPAWAKKSNFHTREIQFLPVALLDGLYYVGLCPHLLVEKVVPQDPARNTGVCHQTFTWRYDRCKAENNPGYTGSVNYQGKELAMTGKKNLIYSHPGKLPPSPGFPPHAPHPPTPAAGCCRKVRDFCPYLQQQSEAQKYCAAAHRPSQKTAQFLLVLLLAPYSNVAGF